MSFLPEDCPKPPKGIVVLGLAVALVVAPTSALAQPREAGSFLTPPPPGRAPVDAAAMGAPPAQSPSAPPASQPAPPAPYPSSPLPPIIGAPEAASPAIPSPPGAPLATPPPTAAWQMPTGPAANVLPPSRLDLPPGVPQRLAALESNLNALSVQGSSIASGVVETITGGLFIGLGVWAHNGGSRQTGNYFYLFGASSIGRAVVDFTLRPNPQKYAIAYSNMPVTTQEAALAKLAYGEQSLRHLAISNRSARIIDGGLQVAVGAISIPILVGPDGFSHADAFTYILAISGGLTIVTGLIALLQPTNAERRWKAYRRLVAQLEARAPGRVSLLDTRVRFGAAVTPTGFSASLRVSF